MYTSPKFCKRCQEPKSLCQCPPIFSPHELAKRIDSYLNNTTANDRQRIKYVKEMIEDHLEL